MTDNLKIVIEIPNTGLEEDILRKGEWEDDSLFGRSLRNALMQFTKCHEWIPVNERLPEENKTVIASTEYGVFPEARYTEEWGWEWAYEAGADYWVELEDVTAWMPLPEPYKAESEGT